MERAINSLLEAARSAPSGDNTQPVRFVVDLAARTIALVLDPGRDPSPMNAGQRMARMAAGAALENLVRAAEARGLAPSIAGGPGGRTLAVVRLDGDSADRPVPAPVATDRVTNRRPYDGRPVEPAVVADLAASCPPVDGVRTHWVVGADRVAAFADLIGRGDALMFGDPTIRRSFLGAVRFDDPPGHASAEGLPLDSLEVGRPDRLALRAIRGAPDWMIRLGGAAGAFARKARALVAGASGLCLIVAPDGSEATDLAVGRALQRSWVELAARGFAAQPMMSPIVLANIEANGADSLRAALRPHRLRAIADGLRAIAPEVGDGRPAWLLRFGHADPPSGRTGRLPIGRLTGPSSS